MMPFYLNPRLVAMAEIFGLPFTTRSQAKKPEPSQWVDFKPFHIASQAEIDSLMRDAVEQAHKDSINID